MHSEAVLDGKASLLDAIAARGSPVSIEVRLRRKRHKFVGTVPYLVETGRRESRDKSRK